MNFDVSDEQKMLKEQAGGLLGERSTPDRLRELLAEGAEMDTGLWNEVAEMGLLAAAIPEDFGGVGLGETDLCIIAEEMGRVCAPIPFFSSICLAAEAIRIAGTEAQKAEWLPKLATGEVIGTFAWNEGLGAASETKLAVKLSGGTVSGLKSPVPDAGVAHICVVVADDGGKPCLAIVDLSQPGVTRTKLVGFDLLRPHYSLEFKDAKADKMDAGADTLRNLHERAATYCAFEQLGGADNCMWMARDYAMERRTFGRVLASYQAIKHKLADVLCLVELARSNAYFAAWALENSPGEFPVAAATARLSSNRAYEQAARDNLQVHGGIGFTWEANCHFHFRRARLLALALGSEAVWTDRLIDGLVAANDIAA